MDAALAEPPAAPAAPAAPAPTTILASAPAPSPNAAPASSAFNWAKEDGTLDEKWTDKLSDDLKTNPSLLSIRTIPDLAKSYAHTKSLLGTKLEMPGEGAPPEAIANWRKVVGVPETPEGYLGEAKTLRPESVPEALWDPAAEKGFLDLAHKHHIPPAAVKAILGYHADHIQKALGQSEVDQQATLAAETTTLKGEWGEDYTPKLNIAARMAATVGLKTDDPIFTSARVVKAFHAMAALVSEDRLVKGDAQTAIGGSLQERIREIADPTSTSHQARAYRGEFGEGPQREAQEQYHNLLKSSQPQK